MQASVTVTGISDVKKLLSPRTVRKNVEIAMDILKERGLKRAETGFSDLRISPEGFIAHDAQYGWAYDTTERVEYKLTVPTTTVRARKLGGKSRGDFKITASGEAVLFIEFGAGIRYANEHPQAAEFGMGAGTYPDGKGHWDDPKGWWLPVAKAGKRGIKSRGNAPNMPMYYAAKIIKGDAKKVFKAVFRGNTDV